jgi:hypothetical protein
MANMSYCRFENTYSDLADCVGALEDCEELSNSERIYADLMYDMCVDYIRAYNNIFDE